MDLLELYKEENRNILYSMSWLNKNSIFDKSIGSFQDIDLFTFLENINQFDYKNDTFYDDVYYILEYTQDNILYLIENINREIKREHRVMPISQAKEFDRTSILWLSRKNGRTLREKLSGGKNKAVQRYSNIDTYENRILKILLKKLVLVYEARDDLKEFDLLFIKIRKWLKSDEAKSIDEYKKIVYNNILLHHRHYSKIFKSYKWLNSLNEKVKVYANIFPEQIRIIIKFEILSQLQFKSKKYIFPRTLQIDYKDNNFKFKVEGYILDIKLDEIISQITTNFLEKKLPFQFINKFSEQIIEKKLKIKLDQDRLFYTENKIDEVFIDFFRLFPIAKIEEKIIDFPITIKQKIDNSIVNANNTKIIDLNHEIYTLPEVLKTFDTNILKYFLDDFTHYFKEIQLNYIVPDYVNVFEFSQVKKTINSYFQKNRTVPKSIVAGLKHIFDKDVKTNDTLLYIQRNHNNELYVTPLLVKYEEKLKKITNGFYLERHPTKKIKNTSNDMLGSLNKVFEKETSKKLLNKFLQNGLKGIKKESIAFYEKEKIIDLNKFQISRSKNTSIEKIKALYKTNSLFRKKTLFLEDTNKENLVNFEKSMQSESNGFNLWREHLPRLSMEIIRDGYRDEFILVDDKIKIINGNIEMKNHFIIPTNIKELSFPLIFGDENINFEAYITSNELPLQEDLECKLKLTYNYEDETPYKLIFIALDSSIKPLNVKWREIKYKECKDLPIPSYPLKKSWEDFINENGRKTNLLETIEVDFKKIIELNKYLQDNNRESATLSEYWKVDASNKKFQNIDTTLGNTRVYKNKFLYGGDTISFKVVKKERFNEAVNVISNKEYVLLKKNIRFPLLTIWNNGNSLSDINVPSSFRLLTKDAIQAAEEILSLTDINIELESVILFFLASLHQDAPKTIINLLYDYSKNSKKIIFCHIH